MSWLEQRERLVCTLTSTWKWSGALLIADCHFVIDVNVVLYSSFWPEIVQIKPDMSIEGRTVALILKCTFFLASSILKYSIVIYFLCFFEMIPSEWESENIEVF